MDYWRRNYGKSRLDTVRNDEVSEKMDIERTIMDDIEMRQVM
jgi:hypothetical protein